MFYESLIILNISTLNFSEGVPASVFVVPHRTRVVNTSLHFCNWHVKAKRSCVLGDKVFYYIRL